MAFAASSSSTAAANPFSGLGIFLPPTTEKLNRGNHPVWKVQVLSALRGAQLAEFLDPAAAPPDQFLPPKEGAKPQEGEQKEPPVKNPEYATWIAKDQVVLCYILPNLGKEIFTQLTAKVTAASAWGAIEEMFASQSRARLISTRMALATATKGTSTMTEYFTKMKGLDPMVTSVANRSRPISVGELFTQLWSQERRLEMKGGNGG